jgi:DNA-binding transcriptional regulator PaaX
MREYNDDMGKMEKEVRVRARNQKIQKVVLGVIAAAGLLSVAMVAPNALRALKLFGLDKKLKRNKQRSISLSRERLLQAGLIQYQKDGFLCLTNKGEDKLMELERKNYVLIKPKKWDKKWRVLIFDIKEERRVLRDKVRATLVAVGFAHLQDSVWVYPYDCEDLITLMKVDFEIGNDLLYLIVEKIENDSALKKTFGLK